MGFEPTIPRRGYPLSRRVHSASLPPFQLETPLSRFVSGTTLILIPGS